MTETRFIHPFSSSNIKKKNPVFLLPIPPKKSNLFSFSAPNLVLRRRRTTMALISKPFKDSATKSLHQSKFFVLNHLHMGRISDVHRKCRRKWDDFLGRAHCVLSPWKLASLRFVGGDKAVGGERADSDGFDV